MVGLLLWSRFSPRVQSGDRHLVRRKSVDLGWFMSAGLCVVVLVLLLLRPRNRHDLSVQVPRLLHQPSFVHDTTPAVSKLLIASYVIALIAFVAFVVGLSKATTA